MRTALRPSVARDRQGHAGRQHSGIQGGVPAAHTPRGAGTTKRTARAPAKAFATARRAEGGARGLARDRPHVHAQRGPGMEAAHLHNGTARWDPSKVAACGLQAKAVASSARHAMSTAASAGRSAPARPRQLPFPAICRSPALPF